MVRCTSISYIIFKFPISMFTYFKIISSFTKKSYWAQYIWTYGAYNNMYTITRYYNAYQNESVHISFTTTPLQIGERVKQDNPSEATCWRSMPTINSHPPPPMLRICLLLPYWFWIGPLSQPSACYSSPSQAFISVGQLLLYIVGSNHRHEFLCQHQGKM